METTVCRHRASKPISPEHHPINFQLLAVFFGVKNITLALNQKPAALAQYTDFARQTRQTPRRGQTRSLWPGGLFREDCRLYLQPNRNRCQGTNHNARRKRSDAEKPVGNQALQPQQGIDSPNCDKQPDCPVDAN